MAAVGRRPSADGRGTGPPRGAVGARPPVGAADAGPGRRRPLGQRLAQAEAKEPVVAGLADAVRAELRPALQVVRRSDRVGRAAPQARERREERQGQPTGTGVQPPGGAMSTNPAGSMISARSSIPSMTRGPGREKYAEPSTREHRAALDRRQLGQPRRDRGPGPVADRLREVEPARHQEQHLGVHLGDGVPRGRMRLLAVRAEQVPAAGAADLFRHPVTDRERRVEPLEPDHARRAMTGLATRRDPLLDRPESLAQRLDDIDRGILDLGHRPDRGDRVEDPLDRGRLERDDRDLGIDPAGDLVHLAVADRAHPAQLLGQDEVGLDCGQRLLIELVQRRSAVHRRGHPRMDVARRHVRQVLHAPRDHGLADDRRRPVALMRDGDELVLQPDRTDDLGGRREERDDAHQRGSRVPAPSAGSWHSRPEV